jgi:hypothetical protein
MDIDFITDQSGGFNISLTNNPQQVSGNRALLNRFELTFLTTRRLYNLGDTVVQDNFGGDARKFIQTPKVLSDSQGISAAISIAIDQTVESLKNDEPAGLPNTEKLDSAELQSLEIINDIVTAVIKVNPVEAETYDVLQFNLPITRGV